MVTVWVQRYEGVLKEYPTGNYIWSQLVEQAIAIAQTGRKSILLPRAKYEQLLVQNRKLALNIDSKKRKRCFF